MNCGKVPVIRLAYYQKIIHKIQKLFSINFQLMFLTGLCDVGILIVQFILGISQLCYPFAELNFWLERNSLNLTLFMNANKRKNIRVNKRVCAFAHCIWKLDLTLTALLSINRCFGIISPKWATKLFKTQFLIVCRLNE